MSNEEKTTKMILEISDFVLQHGVFPPRGTLSSDGRDMGKALTRYRTGEVHLTKTQLELLELIDHFLSRTEYNIREIELFYEQHGVLPIGDKRMMDTIHSYRIGKVPITLDQQRRLEKIGAFLTPTERMVTFIESYYENYEEIPVRGVKTKEGYDAGNALIGYRTGRRQLTEQQKQRLEKIGVRFRNAMIKDEMDCNIRIISKEQDQLLSEKLKCLKAERELMIQNDDEICKSYIGS